VMGAFQSIRNGQLLYSMLSLAGTEAVGSRSHPIRGPCGGNRLFFSFQIPFKTSSRIDHPTGS